MAKTKGFIRILESIVASIILLTTLAFFFNATIEQTNWDDTFLQIRAQDVVASLAINGTISKSVNSNDQTIVNDAIMNPNIMMLPITVDYSLEVDGIPNSVIRIGCNCTNQQVQDLRNLLSPSLTYKERTISIVVYQAEIDKIHNDMSTNVLFLNGYKNLTSFDNKLDIFLKRGGTIFLAGDLSQSQVNDGLINETFGLKWVSASRSDSGVFFDAGNENITSFKISKYYSNITPETSSFTFSGSATIAIDNGTIVKSGSGLSLAKTNKNIIEGGGRTVWLSNGIGDNTNIVNVTKSLIMWASGERFGLNVKSSSPAKYFKTVYLMNDKDPYKVVLALWKVFQ
ncbi:hypothetical protein HYZ41_04840 [archaeon]|nr:hypothetical protein [archaeon]